MTHALSVEAGIEGSSKLATAQRTSGYGESSSICVKRLETLFVDQNGFCDAPTSSSSGS